MTELVADPSPMRAGSGSDDERPEEPDSPTAIPRLTDPVHIAAAVRKQVEFYFSDANLPTDKHLLKHINKDPEGYVAIKVIANFKRVKALTKDLDVVASALRSSDELVVAEDGRRVRRAAPLPQFDIADIQRRTVIAEHLPDGPTIDSITQLFAKYGTVRMVRICSRGATSSKLPTWITSVGIFGNTGPQQQFALVEFSTAAEAAAAVKGFENPDNWRTSLHVKPLLRSAKGSASSSAMASRDGSFTEGASALKQPRPHSRGSRRSSDAGEVGRARHSIDVAYTPPSARHAGSGGGSAVRHSIDISSVGRWRNDGGGTGSGNGSVVPLPPVPLSPVMIPSVPPAGLLALSPIRTTSAVPEEAAGSAVTAALRGLSSPSPGSPVSRLLGSPVRSSSGGGGGGAAAAVPGTPDSPSRLAASPVPGTPSAHVAALINQIMSGPTGRGSSGGGGSGALGSPVRHSSGAFGSVIHSAERPSSFGGADGASWRTPGGGVGSPRSTPASRMPHVQDLEDESGGALSEASIAAAAAAAGLATLGLTSPSHSNAGTPLAGTPPALAFRKWAKGAADVASPLSTSPNAWVPSHRRAVQALVDAPLPAASSGSDPEVDAAFATASGNKPPRPRRSSTSGGGDGRQRRQSWHATPAAEGDVAALLADDKACQAAQRQDMVAKIEAIRELSFELDPALTAAAVAAASTAGQPRQRRPSHTGSVEGEEGEVGAEGEAKKRRNRQRRRSSSSRRASMEVPVDGSSSGGAGEGEHKGKSKPAKKDYAAWAAATPEFRAFATQHRAATTGGAGSVTPGTTPPKASYLLGSSPGRMSPIRFMSGGVMPGGSSSAGGGHGEAGAAHVPRMPDGTRGFAMGRGRPLQSPPC